MVRNMADEERPVSGTTWGDRTTDRHQELEEANARLSLLHAVNTRLLRSLAWRDVVEAVLDVAEHLLGAERALLFETGAEGAHVVGARGLDTERDFLLTLGAADGPVREALSSGTPVRAASRLLRMPILVLPLTVSGRMSGVLVLAGDGVSVGVGDEEVLQVVARQAAVVLQCAAAVATRETVRPPRHMP
jgi:GAF domain-containing protein